MFSWLEHNVMCIVVEDKQHGSVHLAPRYPIGTMMDADILG